MTNKTQINIVYSPAIGPPKKMYENDEAEVWHSRTKDDSKHNVGMGWYSIKDPKPDDSILVVEPYCVLQRDYQPSFIKRFKYIFTWATKAMPNKVKDKVIAINHPTYHNIPNLKELSNNWTPWSERKNEIIIIANNKSSAHHSELYSLRIHLADILHAYSDYEVSWYGQMPIKKPYFKGKLDNKNKALSEVKFSICTENSYDEKYTHNYFTEKMPDVWMHGAFPIYMGCYNINDMGSFNGCYMDLRPLVNKSGKSWNVNKKLLNEKIVNFNEKNYNDFKININDHVINHKMLETHHAYSNVYEKIIDTLK